MRALIVDGYNRDSRAKFEEVGMRLAWMLYRDLLRKYLPEAEVVPWLSSDEDTPDRFTDEELQQYDMVLWPGCNMTVYHEIPEVQRHKDLCVQAFRLGIPQFGSCWALQLAALVAGGRVEVCKSGREMGIGRNIMLSEAGKSHPLYRGKPPVFCAFESHEDEVTELPAGSTLLAGNAWSRVQAAEVKYLNGVMWATQYHTEYDLNEMARLLEAREERLTKIGYFNGNDDFQHFVGQLDKLVADPTRKDVRWQTGIGDDLLQDSIREVEFKNWLEACVLSGQPTQG